MKLKFPLFLAITLCTGCGVQERSAPRNNVAAPPLHTFALVTDEEKNQTLLDNKIFLWKSNTSVSQSTAVQSAGLLMDRIEDEITALNLTMPPDTDTIARQRYDQELAIHTNAYADAINVVILNTDYFNNRPNIVSFSIQDNTPHVTIQGWEGETFSSKSNIDSRVRVRDVSYEPSGGTWRFRVYNGPTTFGSCEYYDFRVSRNRLDLRDGRIYYQGDVTLVSGGIILRRGVAKFGSASFE